MPFSMIRAQIQNRLWRVSNYMVTEKFKKEVWHQTPFGAKVLEAESSALTPFIARLFGYHLLFLGDVQLATFLESSLISHKIILGSGEQCSELGVIGECDALPFRTESVDVVVLAHVLEHTLNPHRVLSEAHRILIPDGHILITGFNPLSLWGIWHTVMKLKEKTPQYGKMLTFHRIQDWLSLLNFQIVGGHHFLFSPPFFHAKLPMLETWGKRFWPFLGGSYVMVAVKQAVPLTPVRVRRRVKRTLWQPATALPKPTTTRIK